MSKVNEPRSILENPDMNTQKAVAARNNISESIVCVLIFVSFALKKTIVGDTFLYRRRARYWRYCANSF
jgi:hypothetical protein